MLNVAIGPARIQIRSIGFINLLLLIAVVLFWEAYLGSGKRKEECAGNG